MKIPQWMMVASVLLLAAGCAHEQRAQYDQDISPDYSSSANSGELTAAVNGNVAPGKSRSESDNAIVASVRESFLRDPQIAPSVSNIQIIANNGAVLLNGSVQSEGQKRQITSIALQATGVVAVNNQLQIQPSPPSRSPAMENQPTTPPLNPTSLPNGANTIYPQNAPDQNTNSNQMP